MFPFSPANLCRDVFCPRVELIGKRRYFCVEVKMRVSIVCGVGTRLVAKFERKSDKKCALFFLSRSQNMSCFLVFLSISPWLHPAISSHSNRKNISLSIEMFSALFLPPPLCLWSCFLSMKNHPLNPSFFQCLPHAHFSFWPIIRSTLKKKISLKHVKKETQKTVRGTIGGGIEASVIIFSIFVVEYVEMHIDS